MFSGSVSLKSAGFKIGPATGGFIASDRRLSAIFSIIKCNIYYFFSHPMPLNSSFFTPLSFAINEKISIYNKQLLNFIHEYGAEIFSGNNLCI
jgi:hypothetical protein